MQWFLLLMALNSHYMVYRGLVRRQGWSYDRLLKATAPPLTHCEEFICKTEDNRRPNQILVKVCSDVFLTSETKLIKVFGPPPLINALLLMFLLITRKYKVQ